MKARNLSVLVLAISAAFAVQATGTPAPSPVPISTSQSDALAIGQAAAEANAKSDAAAQAKQRQAQQATGGSVSDSSRMYVLPAPMYAPPMAKVDCPAPKIHQKGGALFWNGFSGYDHGTNTDDCIALSLINSLIESCQYGEAQIARGIMLARVLPGYSAPSNAKGYDNLDPDSCYRVHNPPPVLPPAPPLPTNPPTSSNVVAPPVVVPVATKTCPKGQKMNSKGVCYAPAKAEELCADGGKPTTEKVCRPKKMT